MTAAGASDCARLELADAVAVVTVDNPPVNSLANETVDRLTELARQLAGDPEIRAVVLTGAGDKAFVAGADLDEFSQALGQHRVDRGSHGTHAPHAERVGASCRSR